MLCELIWCTGLRVATVTAQMDQAAADVRAVLGLQMENGAMVSLVQIADSQIRNKRQFNVYYGAGGTATITGPPFNLQLATSSGTQQWSEDELPAVPRPLDDLIDSMQGKGPVRIDGDTAVHVVEILAAANQAAATGTCVSSRS